MLLRKSILEMWKWREKENIQSMLRKAVKQYRRNATVILLDRVDYVFPVRSFGEVV